MRILFDQGTPAPLREALASHDVATAYEMGWSQLTNGNLLKEAEASFDAFVTTDQSLQYQQNLSGRRLAIVALWTTSWPKLQRHLPEIVNAIEKLKARDKLEDRTFAELPIVRASEFVKISFVGVRMDPGFRQTIRIFGLDGTTYGTVQVRAYDLTTEELVYDETMWLWPLNDERTEQGQALRPSFSMECDLSSDIPANGHHVRIEIEPLSEGLKFWAFVSVTNNKTQHFYTIVPQ